MTIHHREAFIPDRLKIFVSYSHQDADYLNDDSLLGFLRGLEKDNVEFWTDRRLRPGELWDAVIKANLQEADIALVLVSQAFLDSPYCQNVEIEHCLAQQTHLFPIILSPCDWRRHAWLSSRQFLPGGDRTVEEHYTEPGRRKRLFLEIRERLRERAELIRRSMDKVGMDVTKPPLLKSLPGPVRITLCQRLGEDWADLAVYFGIPADRQRGFTPGRECHDILVWLEERAALSRLPEGLRGIGRPDLVELLNNAG
jgi:hypothetical protein